MTEFYPTRVKELFKLTSFILVVTFVFLSFSSSIFATNYPLILSFNDTNDSFQFYDCSNYTWQPDTSDGYPSPPSLKSASMDSIGVSSICLKVDGPTEVGFWWKVDETPSRVGKLSFYVDEASEPMYVCNSKNWTNHTISLRSEDEHILKWEFNQTKSYKMYPGIGWIDWIVVAPNVSAYYNSFKNGSTTSSIITSNTNQLQNLSNITNNTIYTTISPSGTTYPIAIGSIPYGAYYNGTYYNGSVVFNNITYVYYNNTTVCYDCAHMTDNPLNKSSPAVYNISLSQASITLDSLYIESEQIKFLNKSQFVQINSPVANESFTYNISYNTKMEGPLLIPIEINVSEEIVAYKIYLVLSDSPYRIPITNELINTSGILKRQIDLSIYKNRSSNGFELQFEFYDSRQHRYHNIIVRGLNAVPHLIGDLDGCNVNVGLNSSHYFEQLVNYSKTKHIPKIILNSSKDEYLLEEPLDLSFDLDIEGESETDVIISLDNNSSNHDYIIRPGANHSLSKFTIDGGNCTLIGLLIDNVRNKNVTIANVSFKNFGCSSAYHWGDHSQCCLSNKGFGLSLINSTGICLTNSTFSGYKGIHLFNSMLTMNSCNFSGIFKKQDDTGVFYCVAKYNGTLFGDNSIHKHEIITHNNNYVHEICTDHGKIGTCI